MIDYREGWLPDQRPPRPVDPDRVVVEKADSFVKSLVKLSRQLGLDKPYGPTAVAAGVGELKPVPTPLAEVMEDPTEPAERFVEEGSELADAGDPEITQPEHDAAHVELPDLDEEIPF
jgi:hypothetical protein